MRILFVSHYALPHQGGIEFVVDELSNRFANLGHTVSHLCSDIDHPHGNNHVTYVPVPALNFLENYDIPFPIFNLFALIRATHKALDNVDIVHAHGLLYLSCVVVSWMARRRRIAVVFTEHAGFVKYDRRFINGLQWLAFHSLGHLSCLNSKAINVLNNRIGQEVQPLCRPHEPIHKIYNGVNTSFFRPASPESRDALRQKWNLTRPTVLFVGRLVYKKGIHLIGNIANEAFELVICGRGDFSIDNPNVRMLEPLPQEKLLELYQAADVLIMPSEGEGFPLVVQEALACGLPVIVTDNAVNREYMDDAIACFAELRPEILLGAILSLLENDDQRKMMAKNAREWAITHFDWDHTASAYLDLYTQAIKSTQP